MWFFSRALLGAAISGLLLASVPLASAAVYSPAESASGRHNPTISVQSSGPAIGISLWRAADDHEGSGSRGLRPGDVGRAARLAQERQSRTGICHWHGAWPSCIDGVPLIRPSPRKSRPRSSCREILPRWSLSAPWLAAISSLRRQSDLAAGRRWRRVADHDESALRWLFWWRTTQSLTRGCPTYPTVSLHLFQFFDNGHTGTTGTPGTPGRGCERALSGLAYRRQVR